jgi:hypothetical protein
VTFALHKTEQASEPYRVVPKHKVTITFTAYLYNVSHFSSALQGCLVMALKLNTATGFHCVIFVVLRAVSGKTVIVTGFRPSVF